MLKVLFFFLFSFFSFVVSAEPIITCEDEDVETSFGVFDIKLEIFQLDFKTFSATMSLSKQNKFYKALKQSSLYLWSTYGAEVLVSDGKYSEVNSEGFEHEIMGTKFTISRMLSPDFIGLTSIDLKSSIGNIG